MKNLFTFFILTLISVSVLAQDFETGKIAAALSDAGRVRIYSSTFDTTQIDRSSLLFATAEDAVYNYNSDADSMIASVNVESPLLSDYELVAIADNSYSDLAPDIENEIHIYGWENEGYVIVKMIIKNLEAATLTGTIGLEILPQVDAAYGEESVTSNDGVVTIWRPTTIIQPTTTYTGYKLLSSSLNTLKIIDWFSGYDAVDSDLYNWLNAGAIDPEYASGTDGTVIFVGGEELEIAPDGTGEFHFAVAVGKEQDEMLANIALAEAQYAVLTSIDLEDENIPSEYLLAQNYPNPFNPATTINFSIPEQTNVNLKIYNALGQLVESAINTNLTAGNYSYEFDAGKLTSGIYFYSIATDNFVQTRKMMLVK
jgi:hypothetical protein